MLGPKKKKNGSEDLMDHHGEVGRAIAMAGRKTEKKTRNNIWASTEHGPNEMGQKRKKIVFAIFSDSRKWDQNQKF
jgi:hypothetical protein